MCYFTKLFNLLFYFVFTEFDKNEYIKAITIKWMYEDGDDEMLEAGEVFQDLLPNYKFKFHKYAEIIE